MTTTCRTIICSAAITMLFFAGQMFGLAAQAPAQSVQGAAPAGDVVVGSGNYSPIVQDLDKAIDFYGTLLGLPVPPVQPPGPRPFRNDPPPETNAPADSNIVGARVRVTVADTERTAQVYRDLLHFQPQIGSFGTIPLVDLMGLKGAGLRLTNAQVPGSPLRMEFIELRGV